MKSQKLRAIILLSLFAVATMTITSCNKGYGCPSEFSVGAADIELTDDAC